MGMRDSNDFPPIDDPGSVGGAAPDARHTPPGDTADNTGAPGEPEASELDLPGPDDPVAWSYIEPGTEVVGTNGESLGRVKVMLGTETEGIWHGLALDPPGLGSARIVPADSVRLLTPSQVQVDLSRDQLDALEEFKPRSAE
jgi:hypothetical protein